MRYNTSKHAETRMQQRGISARLVRNVISYGSTHRVPGGAVAKRISRKDLKELDQILPRHELKEMNRQRDVYVVMQHANVLTVGHRTARFHR